MPRVDLVISAHSLPGTAGQENDDAFICRELADGVRLAVVADGVGSALAGGEAARRALEMLADYFAARPAAWTVRRALVEFIGRINRQLFQESSVRHGRAELITTLSAAVVAHGRLYCANLGDSPIYLFRAGRLQALSQVHASAQPGEEQMLTRALGLNEEAVPHCTEVDLEPGDRVLLCTDGVSIPLAQRGLIRQFEHQAAARSFVTAARDALASAEAADDATAVLLEVAARDESAGARQVLEVVPKLSPGLEFPDGRLVRPLDDAQRVWLARTSAGGEVLLKFPPVDAATDELRAEAFLREAWQAARLDAVEFVQSRVPSAPVLQYYVQDYIPAPTLREVLQEGPLPVEAVLGLAQCLCRATQDLARRDLAHGDLKPDNLLVLRTGAAWQFRLIDAGSVAQLFSVTSRAGTASYLAPERFQAAPLSERTEIYAIGAVLHEALTRRLPFGVIERFQTPRFPARAPSVCPSNPAVPQWLDLIIQRALSPSPDERYQHVSELRHQLEHPDQVQPFHSRGAPLIERNPVRFYQLLALGLLVLNLLQLLWWARRE